jgi:PAS domain S-box-containing protein
VKDLNEAGITEQEIYNNPLLFRLLSDAASSGIIVYNKNKLLYVNPYLLKLLGYPKDEILSFNLAEWVDPVYRKMMLDRASKKLSGFKDETHYEFKAKAKNGSGIWFDISTSTFDYNGIKLGFATLYEITERKIIE